MRVDRALLTPALLGAAVVLASCTLISLESLQAGGPGGTGANSTGPSGGPDGDGGNGASSQGAGSQGGAGMGGGVTTNMGGNGNGGGPVFPYAACAVEDGPSVYLAMDGPNTEPNLGSLAGTASYAGVFSFGQPVVQQGSVNSATFDTALSSQLLYDGASSVFGGFKPFSIEVWFRVPETIGTRDLVRFSNNLDRLTLEIRARQDQTGDDSLALRIRTSASDERQVVHYLDLAEPPNQEHHLVAVYRQTASTVFDGAGNANDMALYLDGMLQPEEACCDEVAMPMITGSVLVGAGFAGAVDEVAIYDRELTPAEIQDHHSIGSGAEPCVP